MKQKMAQVNVKLIIINLAFFIMFIPMYILKFIESNIDASCLFDIYMFFRNIISPLMFILIICIGGIPKEIINLKFFILFFIILLTCYFSRDFSFINLFLVLIVIRRIPIEMIFKITLYIGMSLSILVYCIFIYKYFLDQAMFIVDDIYGNRYTFEFSHPNSFSVRVFNLLMIYLLLNKRISFSMILYLFFLIYSIYCFTHSRTMLIMSGLMIILIYFSEKYNFIYNSIIKFLIKNLFLIFMIFFLYVSLYYMDYEELQLVNTYVSGRISMANRVLSDVGVSSILGKNLSMYLEDNNIVLDNMYIYILVSMGIVFSCVLYFSIHRIFSILYIYQLNREIIVISCVLIYSCMEKVFSDIYFSIPLILFSFLIFKNKIFEYRRKENERFN